MIRKKLITALCLLNISIATAGAAGPVSNSFGNFYVGLSGGLGEIDSNPKPLVVTTGLLGKMSDSATFLSLLTVSPQSSGLSGRVYVGSVASISDRYAIGLGPEIGYSQYASSSVTSFEHIAYAPYISFRYKDRITNEGYGIDLLLNASWAYKQIVLALKPGVQYSVQHGVFYSALEAKTIAEDFKLVLKNGQFKSSKISPEVIFQAKWQVFATKPIYLGLSYQYVQGQQVDNYESISFAHINERQMATIDLQYNFG